MLDIVPLFADLGAIIGSLLPIVLLVIWVLSQVVGKQQQPRQRQIEPRHPQQRPQPPLRDFVTEIDAFLERATEMRKGRPPDEVEVLAPVRREHPKAAPVAAPVEAVVVEDQPIEVLPSHGRIAEHVQEYFGQERFEEHTSRLGKVVGEADEKMQSRLLGKFHNQVGQISELEVESSYKQSGRSESDIAESYERNNRKGDEDGLTAISFADIFSSRSTVRQAIVLNEILRRPVGRW